MEHIEHINKIELQGYVGTVRTNEFNGSKVANFTMVTEFMYKSREGNIVSESTWHNIVAWESSQISDLDKIVKGMPVNVTGRLRVSRYTSADGIEKQYHEVMANKIRFLRE